MFRPAMCLVAVGAAVSLLVTGCDDDPPAPPSPPGREMPTLKQTAPQLEPK